MSKTFIMLIKFICSIAPIYFVTFITPRPSSTRKVCWCYDGPGSGRTDHWWPGHWKWNKWKWWPWCHCPWMNIMELVKMMTVVLGIGNNDDTVNGVIDETQTCKCAVIIMIYWCKFFRAGTDFTLILCVFTRFLLVTQHRRFIYNRSCLWVGHEKWSLPPGSLL